MRAILIVAKAVKMTFVKFNNNYDDGISRYKPTIVVMVVVAVIVTTNSVIDSR